MENNFENTLLSYQKQLFGYCLKLTQNKYLAEDLLQQTNLRVLENKDKYTNQQKMINWLFVICRRIFIDGRIKLSCRKTTTYATELEIKNYLSRLIELQTPESILIDKELNLLIEENCEDYMLMFVRGYKYNEISELLKIPNTSTLRVKIHNNRKILTNKIEEFNKN